MRSPIFAATVIATFVAYAHADSSFGPPAVAPSEVVLVARGTPVLVRTAALPGLGSELSRLVVGGVGYVLGERNLEAVGGGRESPPTGWPLAFTRGGRATRLDAAAVAPATAALWALLSFSLDQHAGDLRVIEVRARYSDGLSIWLNGVPVARRGLAADASPLAAAERTRGPEWESFFVPVTPGLLRAGVNIVAIEVHPGARRTAPELDVEVVGRRAMKIVRGPMVHRQGPSAATVVVEADVPARASLEWGPTASLGASLSSPVGGRHRFLLDGLPSGAPVHYRVTLDGVPGPVYRMASAPARSEVLRVAVYGDVRSGHDVHTQLIAAILAEAPDVVVASGDLVMRGSDEGDWQRFFAVTAPLLATAPYYSVVGNHDQGRTGDLGRRMTELFGFPSLPPGMHDSAGWYSFDVAGVHFVMLDSNHYDEPAQKRWLANDLASAQRAGARAILAFTHHGPFSRGPHGGSAIALRDYVPLLTGGGVNLLVGGHDHLYQRGRYLDLEYLVSGGGGAPLYPIRCGVAGQPTCKNPDGMLHVARDHHYVMLAIYPTFLEMCPKRPDGTPLEPCVTYPR